MAISDAAGMLAIAGRTMANTLLAPVKWFVNEAVMPALEKLVPQGAAEIGQMLYTGQAYTPYGPTNTPVPMNDLTIKDMEKHIADPKTPQREVSKEQEIER